MCGIAGIMGPAASTELVRRMVDAQRHRGPDDEGIQDLPTGIDGVKVCLGHRRLSILDLSPAGHQPMHNPSSGLWIVYNGEVYNHRALREELPGDYHSTCDTETLLHAFARWGPAAMERWRGMFALAIWDPGKQELFLCRDRLGIKPLYYAQVGGNFVFASELQAILKTDLVPRELDGEGLNGFLAFGAVQEPATIIKDICLLPAGSWMRVTPDAKIKELRRYWSPPFRSEGGRIDGHSAVLSNGEAAAPIGQLIDEAVECRLLSDVPLGVFLSGGIDSSAIVAAMSRRQHKDINTFTLDFTERGYGEGPFAEQLARRYQTRHHTEVVSASDLLGHFEEALDAADQPSIDGINTYYVCKLARRSGLKVALCGHGGDELFGGYDNFRLIPRVLQFRAVPSPVRALLGTAFRHVAPTRVATRKAASLLRRPVDIYHTYAMARGVFWDDFRAELLGSDQKLIPGSELIRQAVPPGELASDSVNQVSQLELLTYLRNTLLRDADVCSMAHGLEVRVPLLDHKLVELVAPLPGRLKIKGKAPKRLLVEAMGDALPPEIHLRRKQGFVIPYQLWLRGALKPCLDEVLYRDDLTQRIGLRPDAVRQIWDQFQGGFRGVNMQHPLALYILLRWCARNRITA